MTLASRLDTTCYVLFGYSYRKISEAFCALSHTLYDINSESSTTRRSGMIHAGNAITVQMLADGIAEFRFDLQGESVNKFNRATIEDFQAAIAAVKANNDIKGLVVTSGKSTFIVGADITEFGDNFAAGEQAIVDWLMPVHDVFNSFEDLDIPKVAAINGTALGGGFEMCLVCDYRVMSEQAQVGLPEIKLGIYPGFGGSVRLSRLIGIDNAVEWMAMANPKSQLLH
jgi:3-hydroxyacyl-CoA dehydrogenase/enoyl-CoA hydratase/3-hydroxybutyryl-CoA epimerase/enoyl-CoA isomerase